MGFNSTVLILNDRISEIERDPDRFVREMISAIHYHCVSPKNMIDFHPGQSMVMSCAHADTVTVLAVGGNCASVLGYSSGRHDRPEDQEVILRALADKHGFRLVRKPKKKSSAAH